MIDKSGSQIEVLLSTLSFIGVTSSLISAYEEAMGWILRAIPILLLIAACGGNSEEADPGTGNMSPDGFELSVGELASFCIVEDGGGRWLATGEAEEEGDVALEALTGHNAFWFAWSVFHPGTSVWGSNEPIAGDPLASDESGGCGVPCEEILPACAGIDCIPRLTSPTMVDTSSDEASYLRDNDLVVGVMTCEGPRAYPHNILWWHEIINEKLCGEAFSVTLCPLTGSALLFDRSGFVNGEEVELIVSGSLFNSNLTMLDNENGELGSWWSQMALKAIKGPATNRPSPFRAVHETTWGAWKGLHPETKVVSENTGVDRDYQSYPYFNSVTGADYRSDDSNTFRETNPLPDARYGNKDMTFGLVVGDEARAYLWQDLEKEVGGKRGVVRDELGGECALIVFDTEAQFVYAYRCPGDKEVSIETVDL